MSYHPLPNGFRQRTRNGKIARLPEATRERINIMLLDGVRYRDIINALNQAGSPPLPYTISEMNLSNWFKGGYQEWCRRQQVLEVARFGPFPPEHPFAKGSQTAAVSADPPVETIRTTALPPNLPQVRCRSRESHARALFLAGIAK